MARLIAATVSLATPLTAVRGEATWVGGVGSYQDAANWSGNVVPNAYESILVNNGGTVQTTGTIAVDGVSLGGGSTLAVLAGGYPEFNASETFYAGISGVGTLTAGSQAFVTTGDFYAGYTTGSTGVVTMDGAYLSPFTFYAGYEGNATVTLENGATLQSTTGYVAYSAGSQGTVNLTDSTWKAESQGLPVDITVGRSGNGSIQATNSLISAQNFVLAANTGSTANVTVSGGTLTAQSLTQVGNAGNGTLSLSNSATATSHGITAAVLAGSTGTLSATNSTVTSSDDIVIGLGGNGTLQTNGAQIHAPELFVGKNSGSVSTATLSGGSLTLTGELHVGAGGSGTLTLQGGGEIHTDRGNMGFDAGSTGEITIANGSWTNAHALFVGVTGHGTLNIGADGTISSESGYLAQNAAGVGTVNITGGSWTMSNTLAVGVNGQAGLSVTNGGQVFSAWGQIGLNAGSVGEVTIDNAAWTSTQTLTIGSGGNGEFTARNGSVLTAGTIELAATANVSGSLHVTNSTVLTMNIGAASGTATADFSGAQLKVLNGSSLTDTLLIYGFAPGAAVIGSGGLTVDTQGSKAQITSSLAGTGALTKTGLGRLHLTTGNTYSGGTNIQSGELEIGSASALGTGGLRIGSGELRAVANVTLSGSSAPPSLTVSANQIGTLSTTNGNTLTVATPALTLENGAGLQFGSAGNPGTIVFSPGTTTATTVSQLIVAAGTLQAGNGQLEQLTALADSTTVASGATLDFQDQLSGSGIKVLNGAGTVNTGTLSTTTLTVHSGNFAGSIAGSGALVKNSPGTLILSGQNAFMGNTTVNAGTLIVDGDLLFGLGMAHVNPGATLGGNGILGTIFLDGGTVAPGSLNASGTLTAQNLYWTSGTLLFDLGSSSDLLSVGGLEGFGTTYAFTFVDRGWTPGATYTLVNFISTSIAINSFRYTNGGGFSGNFAFSGNDLLFTVTSVPEPSTWIIAACAAAAAGLHRFRRRPR